jgi:hypothetical protein
MDRIFKQNISTPNFITILLGRYNDPMEKFIGDLTYASLKTCLCLYDVFLSVGDIVSGYEAVSSQPQLNVTLGIVSFLYLMY